MMAFKPCFECEHNESEKITAECLECVDKSSWREKMIDKDMWKPLRATISFPILNNLTPTIESCTMKVLEEVGELMQMIGKGQGKSGEKQTIGTEGLAIKTAFEALDVAQSAITMAHTLCEDHNLSLIAMMEQHEAKLRERGYLK